MKTFASFIFSFLTVAAFSQPITGQFGSGKTATKINGTLLTDSGLTLPNTLTFTPTRAGSIRYNLTSNKVETWNGSTWNEVGGGGGGTVGIDNDFSSPTTSRVPSTQAVKSALDTKQSYLGYTVITDYGAVGNGSTDNTSAIQAAINATPPYGTLFIPLGIFNVSATITRSNGPIRILGAGSKYNGSTLRMTTANTTLLSITVPEGTVLSQQDSASHIDHLRIQGPFGNTSGAGVNCFTSMLANDMAIYGFYNTYVQGNGGYYGGFTDCKFALGTNAGFLGTAVLNFNYSFSHCNFESNAYGVFCQNSSGDGERIHFDNGCTIERNFFAGLYLDGMVAVGINNCYFEQSTDNAHDIYLGANYLTKDVKIQSCWFTKYPGTSLWHLNMNKADRVTVEGCRMDGSGSSGGDIKGTANTVNLVLINTEYYSESYVNAPSRIENSSISAGGKGDIDGNGVGFYPTNSFGGTTKRWGISVDNAYGKGLNFSEPGVVDGRLFIQQGTGNVFVGGTTTLGNDYKLQVHGDVYFTGGITAAATRNNSSALKMLVFDSATRGFYYTDKPGLGMTFGGADGIYKDGDTLRLGGGIRNDAMLNANLSSLNIISNIKNDGSGHLKILATPGYGAVGAGLTLDATYFGGHQYSIFSTGNAAGIGQGHFAIYDVTTQSYPLICEGDGSLRLPAYAGTTTRVPFINSTGNVGTIPNGPNGTVFTMVSGAPAWASSGSVASSQKVTLYSALTNGATYTIPDSTDVLIVDPESATSSNTFVLPTKPNGKSITLMFGGLISPGNSVVSSLTIAAPSGWTIYTSVTPSTASGGDSFEFVSDTSNNRLRRKIL